MIKLQPDELVAVAKYVYSLCAVVLDQSKGYLIEGRLGGLVEESGCSTFSQFVLRARADATNHWNRRITNAITTNETLFFRDTAPFELLRFKILPEIIDRRNRSGNKSPIRIWSAASSTGQELYSIAMTIREAVPDYMRYGFRLLGTDVSDDAVARASRGIYSEVEMSRGLSEAMRDKYFHRVAGGWQVRDELRGMGSFRRLNLMEDFAALGRFDVVFCRNVAIYFNEPDRVKLFSRIDRAMERDGYLLVGSMESLSGICPQFESKRHLRAVFYQSRQPVLSGVGVR